MSRSCLVGYLAEKEQIKDPDRGPIRRLSREWPHKAAIRENEYVFAIYDRDRRNFIHSVFSRSVFGKIGVAAGPWALTRGVKRLLSIRLPTSALLPTVQPSFFLPPEMF